MDDRLEVESYRDADFSEVNDGVARRALLLAGPRGRAIDLGTGPAEIPVFLCRRAPLWRVLAVDASRNMLREAARRVAQEGLGQRIRLLLGDAKRLRRLPGGFDLVLSNSLLHHLQDPIPFWREVGRLAGLARRGGKRGMVMVQDLARPADRASARRLVRLHSQGAAPLLKELFYRSLLAAFTPREVRAQLQAAGLGGLNVRRISDRHLVVYGRPVRRKAAQAAARPRRSKS